MSQPEFEQNYMFGVPKVYPGQSVLIQLIVNPDPDEQTFPVRMPIHDPQLCVPNATEVRSKEEILQEDLHRWTICPNCIENWALHYYITLGETPFDMGLRS